MLLALGLGRLLVEATRERRKRNDTVKGIVAQAPYRFFRSSFPGSSWMASNNSPTAVGIISNRERADL